VLNLLGGLAGLAVQASIFLIVYLLAAPRFGRGLAALFAAVVAVNGYSLALLGLMLLGVPWQPVNLLALGLVALAGSVRGGLARAATVRSPAAFRRLVRTHLGAILILGGAVITQAIAAAASPDLSYDGQFYHGPALAQMIQHGTLWGWEAPNQYMYYSDLAMVGGLNLATFTGAAVFDNAVQIPHLVMLMLAISELLRSRFTSSWVRMSFAALIVTAPVIWLQPRILYNDLAYAAAVLVAILMIVAVRRTGAFEMVIVGVSAVSSVAIKPAGILTGLVLLAAYALTVVVRARPEGARAVSRLLGRLVVISVVCGLLGAGFYIRNAVLFGNPVYPVGASIGPIRFEGIVDLGLFASGDRGTGFVDPLRWVTYIRGIGHGALNGVEKLDYDPRLGGFGYLPWAVAAIALLGIAGGLLRARRWGSGRHWGAVSWRTPVGIVAVVAAVLLVQPSTFDSRYVMAPTAALICAVLLAGFGLSVPRWIQLTAGAVALVLAVTQLISVERSLYPGLSAIRELRGLPSTLQPTTPGNPWGQGDRIAWLPDGDCVQIAAQTKGGLGTEGMIESAPLTSFAYSLYGSQLCNRVVPVQIDAYEADLPAVSDPILGSHYLLIYASDVNRWKEALRDRWDCWRSLQQVEGTQQFPTATEVFTNTCR
jgi:hypothetical protein